MELTTWNPFREIDELFGRYGRGGRASLSEGAWLPPVDISETDGEYLVKAELPGIDKKDVHLSVENHVLTLEGERRSETDEQKEKSHRVERYYGRFVRSFNLPEDADEEGIRAESRDGVLHVHVPKTQSERPRKIKVDVQ